MVILYKSFNIVAFELFIIFPIAKYAQNLIYLCTNMYFIWAVMRPVENDFRFLFLL